MSCVQLYLADDDVGEAEARKIYVRKKILRQVYDSIKRKDRQGLFVRFITWNADKFVLLTSLNSTYMIIPKV